MPKKRVLIAVMALVACLAIVLVPAATAKKKKVKLFPATITLSVKTTDPNPYSPYTQGSGTFSGQVSSGGPQACRAGRTVTISRGGTIAAQVATQTNGSYSVTVPVKPPAGTYTASVPKITIKKKNKKTGKVKKKKCLAATSNPVVVP
jgi:hypothetical protein